MNQEKISNLIKQLRKKENLTQAQFANKYNVTFQAVSKWENGKSLPDIVLLKQICKDYNISIDEVLEGEINKKNKYLLLIPLIVILIIGLVFILKKDDFEFKTSYDMEDDLINHIRFKEALNHLNNMSYEKRISFILKHYYGYSIE